MASSTNIELQRGAGSNSFGQDALRRAQGCDRQGGIRHMFCRIPKLVLPTGVVFALHGNATAVVDFLGSWGHLLSADVYLPTFWLQDAFSVVSCCGLMTVHRLLKLFAFMLTPRPSLCRV